MKKTFRLIGIVIMAIICCGLTACGGDDDDSNNGAISEYVGSWSCTSPATYQTSTIVTKRYNSFDNVFWRYDVDYA